jgi:biopolymer transport protein ExbD
MPLTSMIDVTFLLLTYFLLTTTFRQAEGQLPGTLPGPEPIMPVKMISLHVHASGTDLQSVVYSVGGDDTPLRSPQELEGFLQAERDWIGPEATATVIIHAGRAVRWRYVVEACNQATKASFQTTISVQDRT